MAGTVHIVCPYCHATNRVREDGVTAARCGQCRRPLFDGHSIGLTSEAFTRHVQHSGIPVVVDFWAPWCGPCRMMAPAYEAAAKELEPSVRFAKVNTDEEQDLAGRLGIQSIPTVILFKEGREVARQAGAMGAPQLMNWIRSHR